MRITIICFSLIVFQALTVNAQELNKVHIDESINRDILINHCNIEGLQGRIFGEYFEEEFESYEFKQKIIDELSEIKKDYSIIIILGTWCHDSQMQVPRFIKIIQAMDFDESKLEIIGVNSAKTTISISIEDLGIEYVPTFIIYNKKGKEIGRIIESPENTLEEDLLAILK